MNRGVLKKNLIALVCAAVVAVALLLPAGLQGKIAPSSPVSQVALEQASDQVTSDNQGEGSSAAVSPVDYQEPAPDSGQSGGEPPDEPEYVPGEILVGLDDGVTAEQLNAQLGSMDYVATRSVSEDDIMLGYVKLELAEGVSVEEAAARVKDEPLVKGAQPNYVYYAQDSSDEDASYSAASLQAGEVDEGALTGQSTVINDKKRNNQWGLEAVHAYEAWDTVRTEGRVVVAVLDSGVNAGHEDLQGRVLSGYNTIDKNATVTDNTGHGTHISGIIAATANNDTGVAGVSYNATILPVKVMESNKTNTENVLAGMTYVAGLTGSNAPKVMNISIGSSSAWDGGADSALVSALRVVHNRGILVVYAAANKDGGTATTAWESYPVDFDLNAAGNEGHPGSIGVINAQQDGSGYKRNNSSNFNVEGKKTKTLCAPGSSIYSTTKGGEYGYMSGTSMAAPHVAGIAALVFAANPTLTAADVKTILEDTATDMGSGGWDNETGYGMVNAEGAVKEAARRQGGVGAAPTLSGSKNLRVNETLTLTVANGSSRTWTWATSRGGIALVEGNGTSATVFGVGAGTATITATSDDGIQLSHDVTVAASTTPFENAQITLSQTQYDYTGNACEPGVTVTIVENGSTVTLRPNVDYTVSYANNVDATTMALVYVTGKGAYANAGRLARTFVIKPISISPAAVQPTETSYYDGGPKTPPLLVTMNGKTLVKDVDYTVKDSDYTNNVNVTGPSPSQKAHVVVTGKGNYTGVTEQWDFDILPASITRVELSQSTYIYSGSACSPTVRVYGPKNGKADQLLTENVDYTVKKPDGRTEVGRYDYAVQGKGNYVGDLTTTLEVVEETLARVQVAPTTFTYDGGVKTPSVTVWGASGRQLIEGQDYTLSRPNGRINVGTYTYTATPKGGTGGTQKSGSFTIKQGSLGSVRLSQYSYTYDGGVKTPVVTVTSTTGKVLTEGEDYVLTKPSGRSAAGTYTYTARPINNYGGASQSASFTIGKQSLKNAQVTLSYYSTAYDGSAKTPSVTVVVGGKRLAQGQDYSVTYSNNVNVGTARVTVTGKGNYADSYNASFTIFTSTTDATRGHGVQYRTHVQNVGWQSYVRDGATAGTSGRSLRLEGINISLADHPYSGSIYYSTHVQNIGWQDPVRDGAMAGTSGRALRLEAIRIWLTDQMAAHYDVYYRVHAQNVGWMGWAKNGESAGTAGYGYRLEAIQIVLMPKGSGAPQTSPPNAFSGPFKADQIQYRTHVQNDGWQSYVGDGAMSGTSGRSLRLEGINIRIGPNSGLSGGVQYRTHVQNIGWQGWKSNGAMSGTSGRALRLEAIQIQLTGDVATKYDVYYRVHCQNFGWMGWAKNGESAGSAGFAYRLEGIEIRLVPKGGSAPGSTYGAFRQR